LKKIFLDSNNYKVGDSVFIKGNDYHHLSRVLRVKIDEKFIIGDTNNNEYYGKIKRIEKDKILIILEDIVKRNIEKKPIITLFFSLLKSDKNELIIQKCTEIGIDKFVPVKTKNCIPNIDNQSKKILRWNKIIKEASMQSCREKIPVLNDVILFENIFNYSYNSKEKKIFGYISEKGKNLFDFIRENNNLNYVSLFIGPEGDFEKDEINKLKENGWEGVSLSSYILKSETAAVYLSSIILFSYFK